MDKIEVFQILGIDSTKDERVIKNAYREKLTVTNPEDDPEGFKQLRVAYEEACRLAKQPEGEPEEKQKKDETPSGLWVEKAAGLYEKISSRQNAELWKELFHDDCFLSLEEEENCREKLLVFLMSHFKLPTEIWKLLDERLGIVKGAAALRERFPADFVRYIVNKCERGEDVDFGQFEGAEDAPYDLFLQYYDRCWQAIQEKNPEQAAQYLQNADDLKIYHPVMEICRASLYERQDKVQDAVALLERLREKYPEDAMICYNTAEMLWRNAGQGADYRRRSAEIYQKLKADNDTHYMANVRLTEWYYEAGQYKEAKKCAEKVLASGSDDEFIKLLHKVNAEIEKELEKEYRERHGWEEALELCWCYLQDGRTSRGIRLAETLEKQLPPEKEAEWKGLMSKLYVEASEYEKSIVMTKSWEEALEKKLLSEEGEEREKDLDRVRQAHMIRMQCFHSLGYKEESNWAKAVQEGESLLDGSIKDIGVLLELSHIYTEMKEYEKSLEIADKLVNEYQIFAAYANSLEVYRRQLDAAGVVRSATKCIQNFPGFVKAYEYVAKVYLDLQRQDDLQKVLEDAEKNGVKSVILDAYRYQSTHKPMDIKQLNRELKSFRQDFRKPLEEGKPTYYEQGLPLLLKYVYNYPDSYMMVELAIFHRAGHHYEEAKECFEKAISLSPSNAYAFNGLSFTYKYMGEYENALTCIKKAILYMDDEMSPVIYTDMAELYSLLGDYEHALAALRQYESVIKEKEGEGKPGKWFMDSLAETLMNLGQYDEAEEIYKTVYENSTQRCCEKLIDLYLKSGQEEKIAGVLRQWEGSIYGSKPEFLKCYSARGWMELIFGSPRAAVKAFQTALKKGSDEFIKGKIADAVFACVACGDNRKGAKYAAKLAKLLAEEKFAGQDKYFNSGKAHLQLEVFAAWYTASDEELQKLFDKESVCGICHNCTSAVCREMEGARILFMVRRGMLEEAKERLRRNLEVQSADEYMLAIKHTVFGGMQEFGVKKNRRL